VHRVLAAERFRFRTLRANRKISSEGSRNRISVTDIERQYDTFALSAASGE
jgi:hypothetical protein